MNNLSKYITEKLHIRKGMIKEVNLYIFIPYGFSYNYFRDNFGKYYYIIKFKESQLQVWFLTKEEILKCNTDKSGADKFDIYKIPEEYQDIDDFNELADTIDGDRLSLKELKKLTIKNDKLV